MLRCQPCQATGSRIGKIAVVKRQGIPMCNEHAEYYKNDFAGKSAVIKKRRKA